MYHTIEELRAGYDEIPEEERSPSFLGYIEQMIENGLYDGPNISLSDPRLNN